MDVRLKPITGADVLPLEKITVTDEQDRFVAPNPITIAQARFEKGAYDFCIWDGDRRVGLIALIDMSEHDDLDEIDDPNAAYVWRLLIGQDLQGKGYGKAAMHLAEDWAKMRGCPLVQIQAVEDNGAAIGLYESLGYKKTGKRAGKEIQLEKKL